MRGELSDVIVGSGPTAYAVALGLLEGGRRPTVVDFGAAPRLPSTARRGASTIAEKSSGAAADPFAYPGTLVSCSGSSGLPLSSVRGGLSTVWGAGVLFRAAADMPELSPVAAGVDAGYAALAGRMALAGENDRISDRFPWPVTTVPAPGSTRFTEIRRRAVHQSDAGVLIGGPRLALDARACVQCGQCLTGCPDRLFFAADQAFRGLERQGRCELAAGPVLRLEPDGDGVWVRTPLGRFRAQRVYLAAGPIATPALLQRSGIIRDRVVVRDSAIFYAPLFNSNPAHGDEQNFTAAQLMVAASSPGDHDFAFSVYESNGEFRDRLARLLRLPPAVIPFPRPLRDRLNAAIGSLPMAASGTLELTFRSGRTWVSLRPNPLTGQAAQRALTRAKSALREVGLHPLVRSTIVPPPGSSYHSGCALPMGGDDLDWSGRLRGVPAIRVVDASALPALWPGSHTFTAMANAHRIGRLAA